MNELCVSFSLFFFYFFLSCSFRATVAKLLIFQSWEKLLARMKLEAIKVSQRTLTDLEYKSKVTTKQRPSVIGGASSQTRYRLWFCSFTFQFCLCLSLKRLIAVESMRRVEEKNCKLLLKYSDASSDLVMRLFSLFSSVGART